MKNNAPLYALNGGEVSKIALARVDVAKMRLAAACQVNWMPFVVGPMQFRAGLLHIGEILGDTPAHLARFVYAKDDTTLIEFTPGNLRIWINEVLLARVMVATSIGDPFFLGLGSWVTTNTTSGCTATVGAGLCTLAAPAVGGLAQIEQTVSVATADFGKEHGIRLTITNGPVTFRAGSTLGAADLIRQTVLDTGVHSLACTPTGPINIQIESTDAWNKMLTGCLIEPPGPVVLPTSWGAGDLPNIRYEQSQDAVYVACNGQQQRRIERRGVRPGARGWSVVLYRAVDGPFQDAPGITANFTCSAYYGNGVLTSDRPWFQGGHVGALFRTFNSGQQNQAVLGNQNAYSQPVRVVGVGTTARNYGWVVTGTWVGTLTLQRSFDGPTSGFVDVSTTTSNGTVSSSTGGTGGTPDLDNAIAWERIGFKGGNYTSGNATVVSNYSGGGGYAVMRVTSVISATQVNVEILSPFASIAATEDWVEAEWSGVAGWPTSVGFHEGRLGWYGGPGGWLSASNNYVSYADINLDGTSTGDGGAINFQFGSGPGDVVSWGLSLTRLQLGREQSIGSMRSDNFDSPLTPTNGVIRDSSDQGAERLPAIKVGKAGIFVQQSGARVYELAFSGQQMDYDDRDLTRLNLDIGATGFVDIDKATQPDKMIWLPRGDGQAAAHLYDTKDEVEAWWRLMTLGIIENVAVLPAATGTEDLVYFVVNRTVNGVTRRFIERLAPRTNAVGGALNQMADCALSYQGAPVVTVQLSWLPNTSCVVWADGKAIGTGTTDVAGNLAMPDGQAHANIVAGLGGAIVNATLGVDGNGNQLSSATLAVGTQYNGYPTEVFADIGSTGEPIHLGSLPVVAGVVTLPNLQVATNITACLGYVAPFVSAKLAYAAQLGSPLNQRKKIGGLGVTLYDTHYQGLQFGQRIDVMDTLPQVEAGQATAAGTIWNQYDEPMFEVPGDWSADARLHLMAQAPLPCTVGAVVIGLTTNEKGT